MCKEDNLCNTLHKHVSKDKVARKPLRLIRVRNTISDLTRFYMNIQDGGGLDSFYKCDTWKTKRVATKIAKYYLNKNFNQQFCLKMTLR